MKPEVDPQDRLKKALAAASKKVSDLTLPLTLIGQQWFKSNRAIFTLQGPGKYADLSTKPFFAFWEKGTLKRQYDGGYKEYKQAKVGFVYPILKRTGLLEDSITQPDHPNSINQIINRKNLVLGTNVSYAHWLHDGTKYMPARPVVLYGNEQVAPGFLNQRVSQWEKIIADYAMQVVGES